MGVFHVFKIVQTAPIAQRVIIIDFCWVYVQFCDISANSAIL